MAEYEVIVIGAGVEGSATAYQLAKQGKTTLLLEQFPLPHTRGSSHGQSRIIRKAYVEEFYAEMMLEAYPMWQQLEKETNSVLYKKLGMLMIGEKASEAVTRTTEALARINCRHRALSSQELKEQYPMLTFNDNYEGVLDEEAGILHADKCLAKLQEMFVRFGGTLHDAEKVTDIHPGRIVTVTTSKSRYTAASIIITAGPWASQLIRPLGLNLPLQPVRVTVCYWKNKSNSAGNIPIFIVSLGGLTDGGSATDMYGLIANEYPNHTKICFHGGPPIDPDARDVNPEIAWDVDAMKKFVREHFPGVEDTPSITERCIYTMTPDENFVLDTHPAWKNIVIGAGFSGHGFKLAPVVGKVLGQLATGAKPSYDMSHFSIKRFNSTSKL